MTAAEPTRTWESSEAAEIWRQGAARRAQFLAVATEKMLDAAGLTEGMRVLDVAAGTGDQSLLAAKKVGPSGSVLATDISESMLKVAADLANDAGLGNVETQVADATSLDLNEGAFDAAMCRFGLMFMPDVPAVLTRIRRALKPGGKFATLVWSTEERNAWIGIQISTVRDMNRMPSPPPSIVRTTALSQPGVLERAFVESGFRSVEVSPVATPRAFESLDDAWTSIQTSSPAQGELTRAMNEAEREDYAAELKRRLAAYVQPDGRCVLPGEALLGVGTK